MKSIRNFYSSIFQLLILLFLTVPTFATATTINGLLDAAMLGDHRDADNIKRDVYRHPKETLLFMGLEADMTVAEIWPGGGWYTEILAPALKGQGILYEAGFATTVDGIPDFIKVIHKEYLSKLEVRPDVYDHVVVTELAAPERVTIAPPGSVDMVLTFRNIHNWMKSDNVEEMFEVFNRALKKDGILGIVEHRAKPGTSLEDMIKSGYVTEEQVIKYAEESGFELIARSEINANDNDSKAHPAGVWTLPPTFRYCGKLDKKEERIACFTKYRLIGESDRMTLKFQKP